jgi:cell division protein FtsB
MTEVRVTRLTPPGRRPAWDWDAPSDLSADDRAELDALRDEVPHLREEVATLRGEIADAADVAESARETLRRIVEAGPLERRRLLRTLRDRRH